MTPKAPELFDADARAEEREQAGLKLGGKVYPRRRRNNKVTQAIRRIARRQDEINDSLHVENAKLDDAADEATSATLTAAEKSAILDTIETLQDQAEDTMFDLLALLLGPPAGEGEAQALSAEQLGEALDYEDAAALASSLMGTDQDDEVEEEPDPTTPSAPSS